MIISFPRKFTNIAVAFVLLVGFGLVVVFGINMVGADTVLPGYATAHLHLSVTVCEKSSVPIKAQFFPSAGRKYYFKERTFEVSPGLNTIEWYIRKIPGGYYNFQVSSAEGAVTPASGTVTLINDQASDLDKLSLVVCTPTTSSGGSTLSDEPGGSVSPTPQASATLNIGAQPAASTSPSPAGSPSAELSVPAIPVPGQGGTSDDLGDLPV